MPSRRRSLVDDYSTPGGIVGEDEVAGMDVEVKDPAGVVLLKTRTRKSGPSWSNTPGCRAGQHGAMVDPSGEVLHGFRLPVGTSTGPPHAYFRSASRILEKSS